MKKDNVNAGIVLCPKWRIHYNAISHLRQPPGIGRQRAHIAIDHLPDGLVLLEESRAIRHIHRNCVWIQLDADNGAGSTLDLVNLNFIKSHFNNVTCQIEMMHDYFIFVIYSILTYNAAAVSAPAPAPKSTTSASSISSNSTLAV